MAPAHRKSDWQRYCRGNTIPQVSVVGKRAAEQHPPRGEGFVQRHSIPPWHRRHYPVVDRQLRRDSGLSSRLMSARALKRRRAIERFDNIQAALVYAVYNHIAKRRGYVINVVGSEEAKAGRAATVQVVA